MTSFTFGFPTTVCSGRGSIWSLLDFFKDVEVKKLLIVTDPGVRNADLFATIMKVMSKSGVDFSVYSDVEPNPSTDVLTEAVNILLAEKFDAVLGVGGGSSLDVAKAAAAMATNPGNVLDYEGVGKLKNPPLPLFAVPTTAGTGSECTPATVITDKKNHFKVSVISPYLYPKFAILDPELVVGLPPSITAATGMDALTHGIESYVSKQANPISKGLAIQSIRMISESLVSSYENGSDLYAREELLIASLMSGIAFSQSRLGNVHAISHTFGGIFNIPHGLANATLLPYVMRYNLKACPDLFKDIAVAMGQDVSGLDSIEAGYKAIKAVSDMNASLNIPSATKELGVDLQYLDSMVNDSMRSGNVLVNPRETNSNDIRNIILKSYNGEISDL